ANRMQRALCTDDAGSSSSQRNRTCTRPPVCAREKSLVPPRRALHHVEPGITAQRALATWTLHRSRAPSIPHRDASRVERSPLGRAHLPADRIGHAIHDAPTPDSRSWPICADSAVAAAATDRGERSHEGEGEADDAEAAGAPRTVRRTSLVGGDIARV